MTSLVQKNFFNLAPMGQDKCWISNIQDYQRGPTLPSVLTCDFFVTAPIFVLHNKSQQHSTYISFSCWFRGIRILSYVLWSQHS